MSGETSQVITCMVLTFKGGNVAINAICTREMRRYSGSTIFVKAALSVHTLSVLLLLKYYTYICKYIHKNLF